MLKYHILSITKDLGFSKSTINPVIIEDNNSLVLFDAGYPGQITDFENEIALLGYSIADIKTIVISHHDHDHIGSLREFKEKNGKIKIIASAFESRFISGNDTSLRIIQALRYNETLHGEEKAFGEQFVQYLRTIKACDIDEVVNENDYVVDGLKVINTPGHTPGHISLLMENEKTLLVGDALAIENGRLVIANPQFTFDIEETINTIRKIRDLGLSRIICYHGNEISSNIESDLNDIINKYEDA